MKLKYIILIIYCCLTVEAIGGNNYLSPTKMAINTDKHQLWVALNTDSSLVVLDLQTDKIVNRIPLGFMPSDLSFSTDMKKLYVTEYDAEGKLHLFSVGATVREEAVVTVGAYPSAICISKNGKEAWVANRFSNDISYVDLPRKRETKRISVSREPRSMSLSTDGKWLVVGNYLPNQSALDKEISAIISVVDVKTKKLQQNISLPDGAHSVNDVCFSEDGKFVYASHVLSRYHFPTTQLERGWMNTNALSIISMDSLEYYNTILLDNVDRGAANPCGLCVTEGGKLNVAISGTSELIVVSLQPLHEKLEQLRVEQPMQFKELQNNLSVMYPYKQRYQLKGKSPRFIVTYGNSLYVSDYHSGALEKIEISQPLKTSSLIVLGDEPEPDNVRKGELFFSDAALCFQQWQSCISCHPDVRSDALNWDLLNDGMGNPKNSKSLLFAHVTPPNMITGIRANAEAAVRAGIKYIQFANRPEEEAACIDAYLKSLKPLASPYLEKGQLSGKAKKGEALFQKTGCIDCHSGIYYTDMKAYNVGTGEGEYKDFRFDTPTLREIWRTAPYLYDGKARTVREILTIYNQNNLHGNTKELNEKELGELEEYILSL